MNNYHAPDNEGMIDELYCVLAKDKTGEGLVSASLDGTHFQLVFGYERMINLVIPLAKQISKETGKKLYLVKFTNKKIL